MKVILTENVHHLGEIGDIVEVKPGYARNFLFPRSLALLADDSNIRQLENQKKQIAKKREKMLVGARDLASKVQGQELLIQVAVGEGGKLYGSVTNMDIQAALKDKGVEVERRAVLLTEPIKALGEYEVAVRLAKGVEAMVKLTVAAQGG
ncbi:MAG: 50S ribosomal protein L9 [Myxococcota bacterium]|nr:50S ribosomal protein L9 [Myxococcota bacterium]